MDSFSKTTDDPAKKFILNSFNRMNSRFKIKMQTITTIHSGGELFPGHLRYSIDAPYRSFYPELTNIYVPKYRLDDLFTDPSSTGGYYYFEYKYVKQHNAFVVANYPPILSKKTLFNYLPMLHSMVTGIKIDWEDARLNFEFATNNRKDFRRILVFYDKFDQREFGISMTWLAVFEINNVNTPYQRFLKIIRAQQDIILNSIQGILYTKLYATILSFIQNRKQYDYAIHLIRDHRHTLKNFGLKGALANFYSKISMNEDARDAFNFVDNLSLLHDYTADILYNFDQGPQNLLLAKNGINTVISILQLIHRSTANADRNLILFDSSLIYHPINLIEDQYLADVFTVLLNLYSNCMNNADKDDYVVNIFLNSDGHYIVEFNNRGGISDNFRDYFLDNRIIELSSTGEGIGLIKSALLRLRHISREIRSFDNRVVVTLTFSNANG